MFGPDVRQLPPPFLRPVHLHTACSVTTPRSCKRE
jgi:hypothetical protein